MEAFDKNIFSNNERPTGKKKMVLIGIITCIVLIVILAVLILFYKQIDATTFKLYIDGTQVSCSDDFYIQDEAGNVYVKARELANNSKKFGQKFTIDKIIQNWLKLFGDLDNYNRKG